MKETKKEEPIVVTKEETDPTITKPEDKSTLPEGSLHLTVIKARDLQKKGMFGKADPYTKITLGKQTFKSPTIDNNQNPEWKYDVTLQILKDSPEEVTIEVFDEDIIGKDDEMGCAKVSLHQIVASKTMLNQWIKLEKCKSGEVLISAEYVPVGAKPVSIVEAKVDSKPTVTIEETEVEKKPEPAKKEAKQEKIIEKTPEPVVTSSDGISETWHV